MDTTWVRSYRPDPRTRDDRPATLSGGYITADLDDLVEFTTASLRHRGHVVLQRYRPLEERAGSYEAYHLLEAKQAEERP